MSVDRDHAKMPFAYAWACPLQINSHCRNTIIVRLHLVSSADLYWARVDQFLSFHYTTKFIFKVAGMVVKVVRKRTDRPL